MAASASGMTLEGCRNVDPAVARMVGQPATLARICDEASILRIGHDYLQKFPEESDRRKLLDILLTKPDGSLASFAAGDPGAISFLEEKTKQDFSVGHTVILSNWILSATEARQSALYFLNTTR